MEETGPRQVLPLKMELSKIYTILVVSNSPQRLLSISTALARSGYSLLRAANSKAAYKLAFNQRPDLIIIEETDNSKQALCRRLKEIDQTSKIPILLTTSASSPVLITDRECENRHPGHPGESLKIPYDDLQLIAVASRLIEHGRAQRIIQDSEQRYRDLFDNANDIVYTHDLEGHYTSLNRKGRELTGYTGEEAATLDSAQIANPQDMALAKRMLRQKLLRATTEPTVYEMTILTKDGRQLPVEISSQLVFRDGKPMGVQGIARDITKRKEDERALRLAHESIERANRRAIIQYQNLLQRISSLAQMLGTARDIATVFNGLLEFTTVSIPCSTLVMALYDPEHNHAIPQFVWTNRTTKELKESQPMIIKAGAARKAILTHNIVITNKQTGKFISLDPDRNGSPPPHSSMTVPMTTTSRIVGLLEIHAHETEAFTEEHNTAMSMAANLAANALENLRLIARDRDRENQLRQAQKMEALGRLAGGVAHDFNNIICAIYGYCDLTMKDLEPGHSARQVITEIKDCGRRAEIFTRQLLGFSRKQVLQPTNLDLNKVITDFSHVLTRLIGDDISINYNLDDRLPLVHLDKSQVEQILMNLAVNSRDAMPRGGRISIDTQLVRPQLRTKGTAGKHGQATPVLLSFSDTGTGIDTETLKHIFEPFFTTKEEGKGTGLGLATVYGSVEQAEGSITVNSQINRGTTFNIRFPAAIQTTEPAEGLNPETPVDHKGAHTILIAEDDHRVRKTIRGALENAGYFVLEAPNGQAALKLFRESQSLVNLVITDLLMPELNGKDLSIRIKATNADMKILYMSGYSSSIITDKGPLPSGIQFIQKPFTHDDILRRVRDMLQSDDQSERGLLVC